MLLLESKICRKQIPKKQLTIFLNICISSHYIVVSFDYGVRGNEDSSSPIDLALAARLAQDAPGLVGDLGSPSAYLDVDPCGYPAVRSGWVDVPQAPGVGGHPGMPELAQLGAHRSWFPATYT